MYEHTKLCMQFGKDHQTLAGRALECESVSPFGKKSEVDKETRY